MNTPNVIVNGLIINSQINLNPKVQFSTLGELADLGTGNVLAYTYYDNMLVFCEEDKNWYIWREKLTPLDATGLVIGDFTYGLSYVSYGIEYSGKTYNFFPVNVAKTITPFGTIQVKKISTNTNNEVIEADDFVVNTILNNNEYLIIGKYVAGDVLERTSYADDNNLQYIKLT